MTSFTICREQDHYTSTPRKRYKTVTEMTPNGTKAKKVQLCVLFTPTHYYPLAFVHTDTVNTQTTQINTSCKHFPYEKKHFPFSLHVEAERAHA